MDLRFTIHFGKIQSGSNIDLSSKLQVSIFKARIDGPSYTKIRKTFKICNDEAIARCLIHPVLGFSWDRTCKGGRSAYLSDADKMQFQAIESEQWHQTNCMTKSRVLIILFELSIG
jgi:hypothetical protein